MYLLQNCQHEIIAPSSLDHFLICKKGGSIVQRHNEIIDAIGDLAALLWNQVKREPVVADDCTNGETLIADLGVRGVWSPQSEVLFDICVIDTDPQLYLTTAPNLVLFRAEGEKKQKYSAAASARRAHFTPLCFSVDGLAGSEAVCFLKRLADLAYPLAGTGLTLKFCAGFGSDQRLLFCMPLAYVYGSLVPSGGALVWRTMRPLII